VSAAVCRLSPFDEATVFGVVSPFSCQHCEISSRYSAITSHRLFSLPACPLASVPNWLSADDVHFFAMAPWHVQILQIVCTSTIFVLLCRRVAHCLLHTLPACGVLGFLSILCLCGCACAPALHMGVGAWLRFYAGSQCL
jgi:hypothetical protein